jgi:hypothetical protein
MRSQKEIKAELKRASQDGVAEPDVLPNNEGALTGYLEGLKFALGKDK